MPSTLDLCEKYFGTRNIYELMNLKKDANEKDGKYLSHLIVASEKSKNRTEKKQTPLEMRLFCCVLRQKIFKMEY